MVHSESGIWQAVDVGESGKDAPNLWKNLVLAILANTRFCGQVPMFPFKILACLPGTDGKSKMPLISSTAVREGTSSHWCCYLLGRSATLLNSLMTPTVPEGRIYAVYIQRSGSCGTRGYPHPVNTQSCCMANPPRTELRDRGTD